MSSKINAANAPSTGRLAIRSRPDLETAANPLAPTTIVEAFTDALHGIPGDQRLKLAILKELNQTSLGDINEIYADLNRHLDNLKVVPKQRSPIVNRGGGVERGGADGKGHGVNAPPPSGGEIDLMAVLQRLAIRCYAPSTAPAPGVGQPSGGMQFSGLGAAAAAAGYALNIPGSGGAAGGGVYSMPAGGMVSAPSGAQSPLAIGQFGGPRILVTPELGDALGRLQHGETV